MNIEWHSLEHAYGKAEDIPALLEQLLTFPAENSYEDEPWFSLWSSLYHQGDIYSASFASVPKIVDILSKSPEKSTYSFFALPTLIEIARHKSEVRIPSSLEDVYFQSLLKLGELAQKVISIGANSEVTQSALAAIAVSAKKYGYAEMIMGIPEKETERVLDWFTSQ